MKRLIICADGTWQNLNQPRPTNIVKLAQAISHHDPQGVAQIVFYDEGIGSDPKRKFSGGITGAGIDLKIEEAYKFLILNYEPGDEIYAFGFSRGAYTVRSLCGLIYASGLPQRACIRRVGEAMGIYRDPEIHPDHTKAVAFRQDCGHPPLADADFRPPITVLGCFDTVGSLGMPDVIPFLPFDAWSRKKRQFHDTKISPNIRCALHAVSIDEDRADFPVTPMQRSKKAPADGQIIEECWFAGGHGSVGGGTEAGAGLSDIALAWMCERLQSADTPGQLALDGEQIPNQLKPNPLQPFATARSGIWKWRPKHQRKPQPDSLFHPAVEARLKAQKEYRPSNLSELPPFKSLFG